jgi:RNA 2',3'-cyclic 3'-phosphodiesterase
LFIAILPRGEALEKIMALSGQQCTKHGLTGKLIGITRLHVSLVGFGDHRGLPPTLVKLAEKVATRTASKTRPFDVSFTRVGSFRNSRRKKPFVLTNSNDNRGLEDLHFLFETELAAFGFSASNNAVFNPHLTLVYDEKVVPEEPIDAVEWNADEIVLVHSRLGESLHFHLGRWRLGG